MQLIQCTKKLADEMGITVEKIDPTSDNNSLNCWHAHLFRINRKKCVVVMNNITRYHFVIYGVTKRELQKLNLLFQKDLVTNLLLDGIKPEVIEQYLNQDPIIQYTATNNRSIISQMNEAIFTIESYFYDEWGINKRDVINIAELNQYLNRTVMLKIPKYPVEMMRAALMQQFSTY
ncbi:DUF6933 domain-containing protein [Bacillus bingmayongensis]|uniref:DUF6933 domain-containing protein n=1 Tax=Bacillus bingmayongensis TaxID=1150157 RepID=UPI00031486ED|nr:hypothetical protein [Bacillus bingmayongensis]MBY0599474.1 hypothetical protein [Bacillus bingmayongensis]